MNDDDTKKLNTEEEIVEETTSNDAQTDVPTQDAGLSPDVTPVGEEAEPTTPAESEEIQEELSEQVDMEMEDSDNDSETPADKEAEEEVQTEVDEENEEAMDDEGVETSTETVDEITVENSKEDDSKDPIAALQDDKNEDETDSGQSQDDSDEVVEEDPKDVNPLAKWYVVHTYSGHENRVATNLRQRIETEALEHKIVDILVPTQDKIEIRGGKKEQVKEKLFPGYMYVKMELDNSTWIAVRTTQGVIGFVGAGTKPMPISDSEVKSIMQFMNQGAAPTFKEVFNVDDPVKIIDGPFADFIGKIETVDKEKGKVRVLVSIFGRETPVELDFLQVSKL